MVIGPRKPDSHPGSTGPRAPKAACGSSDPLEARRVRLATFWALVLRRFRDHAHRIGEPAFGPERYGEEDR
jgi:hypothetical protein